jgi:D-alanyl-D-alanine carboxypeptidase
VRQALIGTALASEGDSMNCHRTITLACLLILCSCVSAKADAIDNYIQTRMRSLHIPGLSLAVVRNGQITKTRGYGLADLQLNVPATENTVYELGSVTKQFTATAVMMLVEEGKVCLDDSIMKYFPEAPAAWKHITVRHLLSHTSGIQNHVAVPGYLGAFRTNLMLETTPARDELLKMFFKLPLEFEPGETWAYDNTGYYLLGMIIEKASGKSYWQFIDEHIFRPLDMNLTRNTDPQRLVPHRASGYEWVKNHYENRPVLLPFIAFSAGSLLSTVEDLAKWDAALYTEKLLKSSTIEQMWTSTKTRDGTTAPFNYGFGWFIDSYQGHRLVQHTGGTPGFSSAIYRFIDDRLTVIILTNHADMVLDQLAIDIAGTYVPMLARPHGRSDPDQQTSAKLREISVGLLNGQHDAALFTPAMRIFLNTATGKAFWRSFESHGALSTFTFSDSEEKGDSRMLRYQVVLGNNRFWFSFRIAEDGRIAQICWW